MEALLLSLKFSLQVKYCSEECRQRAWDHYHRTLCLGQNEGDPSHPLEQLQESWRFFIIYFFQFFISIPHKTFKSIYLSLKLHSFYDFQF